MRKLLILAVSAIAILSLALLGSTWSHNGKASAAAGDTSPDKVLGQLDFISGDPNQANVAPDATTLSSPYSAALDGAGNLYVADFTNDRVLEYNSPLTTGQAANRVFGQGSNISTMFITSDCNLGGVSASSLCGPSGVALDGAGHLYVADSTNNRVLEYNSPLTSQVANHVFGQGGNFNSNTFNLGGASGCGSVCPDASSLDDPSGVALDGAGNLYVTDTNNSRVLEYNSPLTSQVANHVFGQSGSFTTSNCSQFSPQSAGTLCGPSNLALDGAGNLYVADFFNARVLEYDSPLTNQVANRVFGQNSFADNNCNQGATSPGAGTLCAPAGVALDGAGNLYVADSGNSRVLEYDSPLTTNTAADQVFGQGGVFNTGDCNKDQVDPTVPTADTLCAPRGVALDGAGNLYVVDTDNSRVLEYDRPPAATPTPTPSPTPGPTPPDTSVFHDTDGDSLGLTGVFSAGLCPSEGFMAPKFNDCLESYIGTDPSRACAATPIANDEAVDAMPADLNDDQFVNVTDRTLMVLALKAYNNGAGTYNRRYDLNGDGAINITDRTIVALYIKITGSLSCAPPSPTPTPMPTPTPSPVPTPTPTPDPSVFLDTDGDSLGLTGVFGAGCQSGGAMAPKFNNCLENFVGTAPLRACAATRTANDETVDAMPADFNDDQFVNVTDRTLMVLALKAYNNGAGTYNQRFDLNADGAINVTDRTIVQLYIKITGGLACTP